MSLAQETDSRGKKIMSSTVKIFSAAIIAVALVATVTVARTLHTHEDVAGAHHPVSTVGAAPRHAAPSAQHGVACGMTLGTTCGQIETWLPE
jgi:hypothetical protein